MNSNYKKYLIEPEELKTLLNESKEKLSKIRILDGTSFPPTEKKKQK